MTTEQQPTAASTSSHTQTDQTAHQFHFGIGEKIAGQYEVASYLGYGGFSEVYHCTDTSLDRPVAVKVLNEKGLGLKEARAAARLKHPNIVPVYSVSKPEDETPIIVFEYVEGETLEKHLKRLNEQPMSLNEETLHIVQQVAEALDYAHKLGVIHRDVKPSNIMLGSDGKAYLTDFGLAEVKGPPVVFTQDPGSMLTTTIVREHLSGTIPYMAPEQLAKGKSGDADTDMYSFGVVAYQMLTSKLPYSGETILIAEIIAGVPISPTKANPKLPLRVETVLLKALDKSPQNRYSSCVAFAKELAAAAQAYVDANRRYEAAVKLFEGKQYREALAAFESLQRDAPGTGDTIVYIERASRKVEALRRYENVQEALSKNEYQKVLETLSVTIEFDPEWDIDGLRQQAQKRLDEKRQRRLDENYKIAVEQFEKGNYKAASDILREIRAEDQHYNDHAAVEAIASNHVEKQQRLRTLYDDGMDQMGREQWNEAVAIFDTLKHAVLEYRDFSRQSATDQQQAVTEQMLSKLDADMTRQLAIAQQQASLSALYEMAEDFSKQGEFVECIGKLDVLQQKNPYYDQARVSRLRQDVLNCMHDGIKRFLDEGKLEDSQKALKDLRKCCADYSGLDELENQIHDAIQLQKLRAELDDLYQKGRVAVHDEHYSEAWALWQEIQTKSNAGGLSYEDARDVGAQARNGLCRELYGNAEVELNHGNYQKAQSLLGQIQAINPTFRDKNNFKERALAMQRQAEEQAAAALDVQGRAQTAYSQAQEALAQRNYQQALALWHSVRELVPDFPDDQQVVQKAQALQQEIDAQDKDKQAKRAQAQSFYGQALAALDKGKPQQALLFLNQARAVVPDFADSQQVERRAKELQQKQAEQREQLRKTISRYAARAGAALAALLVLVCSATVIAPRVINWLNRPTTTPAPTRVVLAPTVTPSAAPPTSKPPEPTTPVPIPATAVPATPVPVPTTAVPTVVPSMTPTSVSPTPVVSNVATARESSSIFDSNSKELTFVSPGEQVTVLGRSDTAWFYVRNSKGVEGFVSLVRFQWTGDIRSLPDRPFNYRPLTPLPPTGVATGGKLELDVWPTTSNCKARPWTMSIFMAGHGGNGVYTYYWDGVMKGGPTGSSVSFDITFTGSTITVKARIVSGDGQVIERDLLLSAPC